VLEIGLRALDGDQASAHRLRFHTRSLAGLQLLRGEASSALSPLSRPLAARIVRDEVNSRWVAARG